MWMRYKCAQRKKNANEQKFEKIANAFLWCPQMREREREKGGEKKKPIQLIICSELQRTSAMHKLSHSLFVIINFKLLPLLLCHLRRRRRRRSSLSFYLPLSTSFSLSFSRSFDSAAGVFSAFLMQSRSFIAITFLVLALLVFASAWFPDWIFRVIWFLWRDY